MTVLFVMAIPFVRSWQRLWAAHRIGFQAGFICIMSTFFPLLDHSKGEEIVEGQKLDSNRWRLDMSNHMNTGKFLHYHQ